MSDNAAGWQPDPTGRFEHRYWDGSRWTDNVSNAGVASTDPYEAAGAVGGDATAADATAPTPPVDTSATWPAPTAAVPPVPPTPPAFGAAPPGGPGGPPPAASAGSKRGLLIGGGILAAVIIAVVAFLLLGGDDESDRDRIQADMVAQLQDESELSDDQAECIADAIIDDLGTERLKDVDFSADEPPDDLADDYFSAAMASLETCDIDPSEFGGDTTDTTDGGSDGGDGTYGSDPALDELWDQCEDGDYQACDDLYNESPSGSEYEEFADTCGNRNEPQGYCVDVYGDDSGSDTLPGDFEGQIAQIYEDMGLTSDQAECLAGKISDAMSSGDLTEEEAMSDIFGFLEDCDIDPSDITG
jgi:hypothetical protein